MHRLRFIPVLFLLLLALAAPGAAQTGGDDAERIEVNGFFVEEAYNQEAGMLQQIATVTAVRQGGWSGEFSQEWPLFSERHQLDLGIRVGQGEGLTGAGAEYRYLLTGGEDAVFCHDGQFIAGARSREGALRLAQLALQAG